jgi:hypothetical protein
MVSPKMFGVKKTWRPHHLVKIENVPFVKIRMHNSGGCFLCKEPFSSAQPLAMRSAVLSCSQIEITLRSKL